MSLSHHHSHAHTFRHARAHAVASASHARANSMHTPARQPHTPCGPSASACPAACERVCVMSVRYIPPRGVTPPPGVKISGRSKHPVCHQNKTQYATEAPPLPTHKATNVHPQRLHRTRTNAVAREHATDRANSRLAPASMAPSRPHRAHSHAAQEGKARELGKQYLGYSA